MFTQQAIFGVGLTMLVIFAGSVFRARSARRALRGNIAKEGFSYMLLLVYIVWFVAFVSLIASYWAQSVVLIVAAIVLVALALIVQYCYTRAVLKSDSE